MHTEQTIREELQQIRLNMICLSKLEPDPTIIELLASRLYAIENILMWVLEDVKYSNVKMIIEGTLAPEDLKIFKRMILKLKGELNHDERRQ